VTVSINLSSVSLGRRDVAAQFARTIEEHGLPASRLAIEVTETALVGLPQAGAQALDALKQLGIRIVLDDFGTGYSSITRLGRLPFDSLKVDLHLIGLPPATDAERILRAMVELAQALGLQVVAERVEDDATWDEVSRVGCDLIQGFRLSPPLRASEVPTWLEHAAAVH
jgi:EAL domain-containing protein (putative c-di-GMP-specific phosphodiesterase class I)